MVKQLFRLLTKQQRRRFYRLQVLVIVMALMELVGIASIGPFMALVGDPALIVSNDMFAYLYTLSGLKTANQFLFFTGVAVLIALGISSFISIVTSWRMSTFAFSVGTEIADRLYSYYLRQNWLFHVNGSSAQLTKQIATEANRVTQQILKPLTQLNARAILAFLISISIIIYNPIVAFIGLVIFISGYLFIYNLVRHRILKNGKRISQTNIQRYRLMNEGFGGIKDVILLNREETFIDTFKIKGKNLARAQGVNAALMEVPRYIMELIAFGSMIGLVLVLIKMYNGVLSQVLPVLAVYALAGFKLLPALQQVYSSVTEIKGNVAAFAAIKEDLIHSAEMEKSIQANCDLMQDKINILNYKAIQLKNISFAYPNQVNPALKDISLSIPLNISVGFVGESGSGKTTIVDLILGLIEPQEGSFSLDSFPVTFENKRAWQKNIGFVPQSIFLSEGSIAENIAFGIKKDKINFEQVEKSLMLANLKEFVSTLPDGMHTKVGERGIKLSGGQRQRIGIARALYNDAGVLVFDEATSALDGITEKVIMDAIHELSGKRTIILIAHRLKTVQNCDTIFFMNKGKLIEQGSYSELVERNKYFKKMSRFS